MALIKEGDNVGGSEANLLAKLGIRPFSYGLVIQKVIDAGAMYDPKVLDITDADLLANVSGGLRNIAALGLATGVANVASVPHTLINAYKNILAIAVETEWSFPLADKVKAYLADPSAFAAPSGGGGGGGGGGGESKAAAAKEEEPAEESDEEMGMSLFD